MKGGNLNLIGESKSKLFYGYIIAAAGFSIMMVIHGTYNTFGVFFNPLLTYFNLARATLSGASSFAFLTMGIMAIVIGTMTDRFGPRVIMTICASLFGTGLLLLSHVAAVWQIYLFYIVVGMGLSAGDVVPLSVIVRWFVKKRGVMSGIMKVGTGLGMMVIPLVANWLITTYGWRTAYTVHGIIVLAVVIPLAQLLRRDPRQIGQMPDGEKQAQTDGLDLGEQGLSLREAIHTGQFWMVCAFYLTILFCVQTTLVHIVPHAIDLGLTAATAAGTVAIIGGASMVGRLVMGFTGDRIGSKRAMVTCFLILVSALIWLQWARELWMLYLFAAVYGFSHGGFFALISPLIAGLFGTRSQGTLLGVVIFSGTLGGSAGPFVAGTVFDVTGSYRIAFLILLTLAIVGLTLASLLRPLAKRV